jgi:hypothetical protein
MNAIRSRKRDCEPPKKRSVAVGGNNSDLTPASRRSSFPFLSSSTLSRSHMRAVFSLLSAQQFSAEYLRELMSPNLIALTDDRLEVGSLKTAVAWLPARQPALTIVRQHAVTPNKKCRHDSGYASCKSSTVVSTRTFSSIDSIKSRITKRTTCPSRYHVTSIHQVVQTFCVNLYVSSLTLSLTL